LWTLNMIRQLISAVVLLIATSAAVAQTVETTPNLVTNIRGTSGTDVWLGTGGNSQLNGVHPITLWGCCTSYSGSSPFFDTSTTNGNGDSGQIIWSFGNVAVNYIIGINTALANAGTGIQINGYNWRYDVRNMNGGSGQNGVDTLTASSRLWNSTYTTVLLQQSRTHNTTMDWTTFSGTVTAATPHPLANVGNLQLEFRASDSGFWNGYYGPQIRDVQASFNYTATPVDPCVANPQSSPSCPGYTLISDNLVPWPNHWTTNGQSINQTYAINQALSAAGAGVVIHGFNYGYQYNLGSSWTQCTAHNQDGSCSWTMTFNPRVDVNLSIRSNTNTQIHGITHTEIAVNTGNQRRDFQYRFSSPRDILTLGNFNFSASTSHNATVFGMYSRAAYVIDECVANPLSSTTCPGYAQAYLDQQCSANTLYSSQCPGYAQAYFTQQCGLNTLYDPACPGYAQAFYNYQCNLNALYHIGCPGYAAAYFDQQCGLDPLYNNACPGHAAAYFDQQCTANSLYNYACPGYADAYYVQQCTLDPLYDSGCTGYDTAFLAQQCSLNTLYDSACPGYDQAYFDQQCSISALYDQTCPGYAAAYFDQQCGLDPLYNNACPGYTQAFYNLQCSISALYDSGCPGYAQAFFDQQCGLDPLYNNQCPGYAQAYALKFVVNAPSANTAPAAEEITAVAAAEESVVIAAAETAPPAATASPSEPAAPVQLIAEPAAAATQPATAPAPAKTEAAAAAPRTTRQALAEQRLAAAREQAAQKAQENPEAVTAEMDSAGSFEQQTVIQNVVLGAMGFVAGFDAYGRVTLPDGVGYRPFEIYPGQRNIDTPAARALIGRSDRTHEEMVNEQYR
jgi:hypothetical protein